MPDSAPITVSRPESLGFSSERLSRISDWMRRWVDEGKLPFAQTLIARRGEVVFHEVCGLRDIEAGTPAIPDGIVRIYSMTKAMTTVAAMSLLEEARLQLDDPVERYIPELANRKVQEGGRLVDAAGPITVRQLMTHTSGLIYGHYDSGPVGDAMRKAGVDYAVKDAKLKDVTARLASVPLAFQPGTRWQYGISTDVLGRVVEKVAGKRLDKVIAERITGPLEMKDTAFNVSRAKLGRFGPCYTKTATELKKRTDGVKDSSFAGAVTMHSGGGGMVSTARDYLRFTEMLRRGGAYGDVRVLGRKTVDLMFLNHLPGDIAAMGTPTFSEMPMVGIGFGLGGSVLLDPARAQILGSPGEWAWGGVASTGFWIDRAEELSVVFVTQLMPSSSYPIRRELRTLVYQALVG